MCHPESLARMKRRDIPVLGHSCVSPCVVSAFLKLDHRRDSTELDLADPFFASLLGRPCIRLVVEGPIAARKGMVVHLRQLHLERTP